MQLPDAQLETPPRPNPEPENVETVRRAGGNDSNEEALLADSRLAKRCLAGEPAAWDEFYAQCHRPLLLLIEVMLDADHADSNRVDEIVARVWYALIENDGRLLARYDPQKGGRLITFLRTVAKTEVCRHFRREGRRQSCERIALRERPAHQRADDPQTTASLGEFLPTLTVGEREFYEDHLAGRPAGRGGGRLRTPVGQRPAIPPSHP